MVWLLSPIAIVGPSILPNAISASPIRTSLYAEVCPSLMRGETIEGSNCARTASTSWDSVNVVGPDESGYSMPVLTIGAFWTRHRPFGSLTTFGFIYADLSFLSCLLSMTPCVAAALRCLTTSVGPDCDGSRPGLRPPAAFVWLRVVLLDPLPSSRALTLGLGFLPPGLPTLLLSVRWWRCGRDRLGGSTFSRPRPRCLRLLVAGLCGGVRLLLGDLLRRLGCLVRQIELDLRVLLEPRRSLLGDAHLLADVSFQFVIHNDDLCLDGSGQILNDELGIILVVEERDLVNIVAPVPVHIVLNDVFVERVHEPLGDRLQSPGPELDERAAEGAATSFSLTKLHNHQHPASGHRLVVVADRVHYRRVGSLGDVELGPGGNCSTGRIANAEPLRHLVQARDLIERRTRVRLDVRNPARALMVDRVDAEQPILDQPVLVALSEPGAACPIGTFLIPDVSGQAIDGDLRKVAPPVGVVQTSPRDVLDDADQPAVVSDIEVLDRMRRTLRELPQM